MLWLQMNELKYKEWVEKIHTDFLNWMTLGMNQNKWGFYCDIKCLFLQFDTQKKMLMIVNLMVGSIGCFRIPLVFPCF